MAPLTALLFFVFGLIALPWDPAVIPGPLVRKTWPTPADLPIDDPLFTRRTLTFPCEGEQCEAWVYLPKGVKNPPVTILAHGLGGQKDFGLDKYAQNFAQNGIAAFVFDYRTFGGSSGEPRHWVSPKRHVQDYKAAVAYVQSNLADVVNTDQMVLWGTSLSGGHVLVTAADLGKDVIKGIISHVPHTDGAPLVKRNLAARGPLALFRGFVGGMHDLLRSTIKYPAAYYPLAGPQGSFSFMQLTPHELEAYFAKHPKLKQGGWANMACARFVLEASRYRPILSIPKIEVPILFIGAKRDRLCPLGDVEAAAALANNATLVTLDAHHFEIYHGEFLRTAMDGMLQLVRRVTGVAPQQQEEAAAQQDPPAGEAGDAGPEAAAGGSVHQEL